MNVVIAGGGVAGLVAAYTLTEAGHRPTVLEADTRWGGQIWTLARDGFVIEHGAEGYAAGQAAGHDLCRSLHITGRLVSQYDRMSFVLEDNRLTPAPPGRAAELAGIQASREDWGQGITSLAGGMGELIGALIEATAGKADLHRGARALHVEPLSSGWAVTTSAGDTLRADALVLAIPAAEAARLLTPIFPDAAALLATFHAVSSVSVSLAFPQAAVRHPLDGAGFVSSAGPHAEGFRACVFVSSQFPGRAPPEQAMLRAFFRPGRDHPLEAADASWVDLGMGILRPVLGIRGEPAGAWVSRWPDALPRYAPDHDARILAAAQQLRCGPAPLILAGAPYQRAGVAGAIGSARAAAQDLLLAGKP